MSTRPKGVASHESATQKICSFKNTVYFYSFFCIRGAARVISTIITHPGAQQILVYLYGKNIYCLKWVFNHNVFCVLFFSWFKPNETNIYWSLNDSLSIPFRTRNIISKEFKFCWFSRKDDLITLFTLLRLTDSRMCFFATIIPSLECLSLFWWANNKKLELDILMSVFSKTDWKDCVFNRRLFFSKLKLDIDILDINYMFVWGVMTHKIR